MAGLTTAGLEIARQADIITALQAAFRARFGPDIDVDVLDPDSVAGREIAIWSEREALLWELAAALHNALDVDSATGVLLSRLARIPGLTRKAPTATTGRVTLQGVADTVVPEGSIVASEIGVEYTTNEDATIGLGGTVDVNVTAREVGAVPMPEESITVVVTQVAGWTGVEQLTEGTTGTDTELDSALRERMAVASAPGSQNTLDALVSQVLDLDEIEAALVIENDTPDTSADGLPPHSFRLVIYPAVIDETEAELAELIWLNKPGGIYSDGDEEVQALGTDGRLHTVRYSVATEVLMEFEINVDARPEAFPADGADLIKTAVKSVIDGLAVGEDVRTFQLIGAIYAAGIAGLEDVDVLLRRDTTGSFGPGDEDNEAIGNTEVATTDLDHIDVNVTEV